MRVAVALLAVLAVAAASPFDKFTEEELKTKVWAVLAAGSDGWGNYRHQADVCHNYQVLHKLGVPDEHIIVFMKDDIANSPSNPKKGQIINEPGGPDVYAGVPKDYTGKMVSTENFIKVLKGEVPTGGGSGKTLRSTTDDHVFVFFDDHGSTNALCFPEGCKFTGPVLEQTVQAMYDRQLYGTLIFYIEACYAGAVLYKQKLPPNAYFTTASPVGASSFAYNWDSTIRAYVADIYSYLFIHDLETAPMSETFNEQYEMLCVSIQNYSQPCQYGAIDVVGPQSLGSFFQPEVRRGGLDMFLRPPAKPITDAVPAWDVPFHTARRIYEQEPSPANALAYRRELALRSRVDSMAERILARSTSANHFATPPCTTCDQTCKCIQYCGTSAKCKFECCDERSCHLDPPRFGGPSVAAREACQTTLVQAFLDECGVGHDYLRSVERALLRACKDEHVNIDAALATIRAECRA